MTHSVPKATDKLCRSCHKDCQPGHCTVASDNGFCTACNNKDILVYFSADFYFGTCLPLNSNCPKGMYFVAINDSNHSKNECVFTCPTVL